MRIIFCCATIYQLMVAVKIKTDEYGKDMTDIVLLDTIARSAELKNKLEKSKNFCSIFQVECNSMLHSKGYHRYFNTLFRSIRVDYEDFYDIVYFSNYDWVTNKVVCQLRRKNKHAKLCMYEDGYSSYSELYGSFFRGLYTRTPMRLYYQYVYSEMYRVSEMRVFSPDAMEWKPKFPVKSIEKISPNNIEYMDAVNSLFEISMLQDTYEENVIFFEESYFANGVEIDDVAVVNQIASVVGKERILVKLHPRNRIDRFAPIGYKTNSVSEIPWEAIALNIDLADKYLITIASGSALTSLVNMRTKPKKIIMLMNCQEIEYEKLTPTRDTLNRIASLYPKDVYLPSSIGQALEYLSEAFHGGGKE